MKTWGLDGGRGTLAGKLEMKRDIPCGARPSTLDLSGVAGRDDAPMRNAGPNSDLRGWLAVGGGMHITN